MKRIAHRSEMQVVQNPKSPREDSKNTGTIGVNNNRDLLHGSSVIRQLPQLTVPQCKIVIIMIIIRESK